jgi:hypothetical protein
MTHTRIPRLQGHLSSQVTTGTRVFATGGDGRSAWTRRWKDLVASHASDLGDEVLSEGQISLIRRISAMELALEAMEAAMSEGRPVDTDLYGRLVSRLCRALELLGIKRRVQELDPMDQLATALSAYPAAPPDDDELEPEPGEA